MKLNSGGLLTIAPKPLGAAAVVVAVPPKLNAGVVGRLPNTFVVAAPAVAPPKTLVVAGVEVEL